MDKFNLVTLITLLLLAACSPPDDEPLPTVFTLPENVAQLTQQPIAPDATVVVLPTVPPSPDAAPDDSGELAFWQAENDTLTPGEVDRWTFDAQAGDQIAVRVVGIAPALSLLDATGIPLAEGAALDAIIPQAGTYTVLVAVAEGDSGGDYQIGLRYTDRPNPAEMTSTPLPQIVGVPTPITLCNELGQLIRRMDAGETASGSLTTNEDSHLYTFEDTGFAEIEMRRVSGELDPQITIYDADCTPLATDDDSGGDDRALLRNIRLSDTPQLYVIQATGRGLSGDYTLRLRASRDFTPVTPTLVIPPTATATPIFALPTPAPGGIGSRLTENTPLTNTLDEPGDVGIHALNATLGEVISIGVIPTSTPRLLPEVEVVNPDGLIVATATANIQGDVFIPNLLIDLEGAYQIFIRGAQGTTGDYQVSFGRGSTRQDVLQGEALFGQANTASIDWRGVRDLWLAPLQAGDIITAAITPGNGSSLDPILEVVRADDPETILAVDDNSGGERTAFIRRLTITETGLYLLRVRAADANSIGAYTLIWRYITAAPTATPPQAFAPLLTTDDSIQGNGYRFYPFQGRAGQRIRVYVMGQDGFDPVAALLGTDGSVLVEVDDVAGSTNPQFDYTLTADGTYTLRVNGYLTEGAFQISIIELFDTANSR